ncbi:TetR/AcrR family transcriptional regulator [Actinomadura sp. KC216]|uniref:TetR/AcrR family transcriptional regulator n=1 Tax=Actinomadura sp. KC216 TaxID=2530370 RepID=UPI001050748F|nr:TetR/AcrR family transcriptional regulator [Actinomadura sp. KC216]TDB90622.1 TetR/AcrR family transcriptional regulator [Actinomadura sp. KC216]
MTTTARHEASGEEDIPSLVDPSALREPPVTPRGARTRASLVAAARTVFERDGYRDSRLMDITAEANCSAGTFYTYFSDKEEILQAVLQAAQDDMLHPGMPRLDREASSPVAVIEASNRAYFEAYKRNAKMMLILDEVAASDPNFRQVRQRRARAFVERNARAIRKLQAEGLADRDLDPFMAALGLSGMVGRMAHFALALGEDCSIDDLVRASTRLWANALNLTESAAGPER